jgi:DNA processing protein
MFCEAEGIQVTGLGLPLYPRRLLELHDPPAILFWKGDSSFLGVRCVTIVGARRATGYGRRVAERLGRDLAARGVVVLSGLALGIDGAAHRGALSVGGATAAVLGAGVDVAHPPSHRNLHKEIGIRGLLVSEFLPGEAPLAHHFPRRNRLLAALSDAIVVVEARRRSGALITVDHALDLGREIFAVPGSVESPLSEGTNELIRDGAHLLTGVDDLFFRMDWHDSSPTSRVTGLDLGPGASMDPDALALWQALDEGPLLLDDLARASDMEPGRVLSALSRLEIFGWVVQDGGSQIRRREGRREAE